MSCATWNSLSSQLRTQESWASALSSFVRDRVLLCGLAWLWPCNPPVSTSRVLTLQVQTSALVSQASLETDKQHVINAIVSSCRGPFLSSRCHPGIYLLNFVLSYVYTVWWDSWDKGLFSVTLPRWSVPWPLKSEARTEQVSLILILTQILF